MKRKTRVLFMCVDGFYQRQLLARLHGEYEVVGVVIYAAENSHGPMAERLARYRTPNRIAKYIVARAVNWNNDHRAMRLVRTEFPSAPSPPGEYGIRSLQIDNVNRSEATEFVGFLQPDLICVNGTNLLREPMLEVAQQLSCPIINLHTGLSPYARGGNCNLFVLLDERPEFVGVTVHYIDRGIDSGDIIRSARPALAPDITYEEIEGMCFALGIECMLTAVREVLVGTARRVSQWEAGKLYLRRTGYVYEPSQRVLVNRKIRSGLIRRYLADRARFDAGIRLIGDAIA